MARVPRLAGRTAGGDGPQDAADAQSHFCPGCGSPQRRFDRYPWFFCGACLARAEDAEGRRLAFSNASLSGGLGWGYAGEPGLVDTRALAVLCLIAGRPVLVTEARLGGVVAQPLTRGPASHAPGDLQVDLTQAAALASLRERPWSAKP